MRSGPKRLVLRRAPQHARSRAPNALAVQRHRLNERVHLLARTQRKLLQREACNPRQQPNAADIDADIGTWPPFGMDVYDAATKHVEHADVGRSRQSDRYIAGPYTQPYLMADAGIGGRNDKLAAIECNRRRPYSLSCDTTFASITVPPSNRPVCSRNSGRPMISLTFPAVTTLPAAMITTTSAKRTISSIA